MSKTHKKTLLYEKIFAIRVTFAQKYLCRGKNCFFIILIFTITVTLNLSFGQFFFLLFNLSFIITLTLTLVLGHVIIIISFFIFHYESKLSIVQY